MLKSATMKHLQPSIVETLQSYLEKQDDVLDLQVNFLKTLANRYRFRIVAALGQVEGEIEQRDLQKIVGISKANLSQHLAILRDAGVIVSRPHGRVTYVSLRNPAIRDACALVREMIVQRVLSAPSRR